MHVCSAEHEMNTPCMANLLRFTTLNNFLLSNSYNDVIPQSRLHAIMQGDADLSRQYVSALSILFIALFIGLPIWWKTTEVYRCPLPYTEINNLTHQQVYSNALNYRIIRICLVFRPKA